MYIHIAKIVQLGSINDQCYIQNCVVTSHVIKRSRCNCIVVAFFNFILLICIAGYG